MKTLSILLILIKSIDTTIIINVETALNNDNAFVTYSGIEAKVVTAEGINSFFTDTNLKEAVSTHFGTRPKSVYYKKPTPWGDLYTTYNWEQVTSITSVKSARIKNVSKRQVVILSQDFENSSNQTIKVNTGLSHTVENSITTSWSKSKEITISQEIEYNVNFITGSTGVSYASTLGQSEETSQTVTVGSTSAMETELKPKQAVTAELSVNSGILEIEIMYKVSLRGNVATNFKKKLNGHHFWGPQIQDVMKSAGVKNEKTFLETIKFGFHVDAKLHVRDKSTV